MIYNKKNYTTFWNKAKLSKLFILLCLYFYILCAIKRGLFSNRYVENKEFTETKQTIVQNIFYDGLYNTTHYLFNIQSTKTYSLFYWSDLYQL